MTTTPHAPVRLPVPRHLQDCNGYCGPACVMMVRSGEPGAGVTVEGQHGMFRKVRDHARQANDRRPVKSPAESLLALLNGGNRAWRKVFNPESAPVAAQIVQAVEETGQPCLLLVSKGMHWVVAFGRTLREDGSAAGVLLRDPAWAGMPRFFGLTTMPEKPTFAHSADTPCTCLASDNPPGSVHERYVAMDELLSPRGLQGSPDWEGKGALALIPVAAGANSADVPSPAAAPPLAGMTPQAAAMSEAREHGLTGRPDSPLDWDHVLEGGQPGTPILVKDPEDPRDNFLLVPIHSASAADRRTAWILLDPVTLRMREASLLDNWMMPSFPTDQDANNIADHDISLPGGKRHRFKKSELRPNQRNLVWQASAASLLPYWPMREFTAAHPDTGEAVSIYATQHGEIYTSLGPDDLPATQTPAAPSQPPAKAEPSPSAPKSTNWKNWLSMGVAAAGITTAAVKMLPDKHPETPPHKLTAPSSVQVTDITPTSAVAAWEAVPGALSYNVEYKEQSSATWTLADAGNTGARSFAMLASVTPWFAQTSPLTTEVATSRELTSLTEGTRYEVRVSAIGPRGKSAPSPATPFQTPHSELLPPDGLTALQMTTESALVTWQAVPRATSYKLKYRATGAENWQLADDQITDTRYTLESLKEATKYEVHAITNGPGGSSGPTAPVPFETLAGILQAPQLIAGDTTSDSVLISWQAVPRAQSYKLTYKAAGSEKWLQAGGKISDTHFTLSALKPGTVYFAKGVAIGPAGTSEASQEVKFKTEPLPPPDAPGPPDPLIAPPDSITETSASLTWKAVPGAVTYRLEYREASVRDWTPSEDNLKATRQQLRGLNPGTAYAARASARGPGGDSEWTPTVIFETKESRMELLPPDPIQVSEITVNSALVSWEGVGVAATYALEWKETTASQWTAEPTALKAPRRPLGQLKPATEYQVRVATNGPGGKSAWSPGKKFRTAMMEAPPGPPDPLDAPIERLGATSAMIVWKGIPNATSYHLQFKEADAPRWATAGDAIAATRFPLSGLKEGTLYSARAASNAPGWKSQWSTVINFSTEAKIMAKINPPDPLKIDGTANDGANIYWEAVPDAFSYKLEYKEEVGGKWITADAAIQGTLYPLRGLKAATSYLVRAYSNGPHGMSDASAAVKFRTGQEPIKLTSPDPIRATEITADSALVSWREVPEALSYVLEYMEVSGTKMTTAGNAIKGRQHHLTGLKPGTEYVVRASTNMASGTSGPCRPATFKTAMPHECQPPTDIEAIRQDLRVSVTWKAAPGAVSYKLEQLIRGDQWALVNAEIKETHFDIAHGETSAIRVSTNCADGTSPHSREVKVGGNAWPIETTEPDKTKVPVKTLLEDGIKQLSGTPNLTEEDTIRLRKMRELLQQLVETKEPARLAKLESAILALLEPGSTGSQGKPETSPRGSQVPETSPRRVPGIPGRGPSRPLR